MPADSTILTVKDLNIIHTESGKHLLSKVSFSIGQGEWIGLVGPSGAGKTTLVHALLGLLPLGIEIAEGSILFESMELTKVSERELAGIRGKSLSMIFQDPLASLNPVLSCGVQVEEPLRIHSKFSAGDRYERAIIVLQEVGFTDPERIYHSMPRKLSGGQRQRVMLAMAIILKPQLLIADEPTSALDQDAAEHLLNIIARLRKQRQLSVLLISHDRELVDQYANRSLFMKKGKLLTQSPTAPPSLTKNIRSLRDKTKHPLLKVRSVTKSFTRSNFFGTKNSIAIFEDISFTVYPGEIVGLVGVSGAGKTTLGRCIAGMETIDDGEIQIAGRNIPKIKASWQQKTPHPVQIIYQSPYASLPPHMSVGQIIEEALPREMSKEEKQKKTVGVLSQVDLPVKYYTRLPKQLSGGERQRVAIARCLAGQPTLIIADEPTASLDGTVKKQILDIFVKLAQDSDMGILLISHDNASMQRTCSRVYSLQELQPTTEEGIS